MPRKAQAHEIVRTHKDFRIDFSPWLETNWHIFEEFERLAIAAIKRGRPRLSAYFLFELIRWQTATSEDGELKLNNFFRADCARLFERINPQHAGHFEFRKRR